MTSSDIHKSLQQMWPSVKGEWAYIKELRVSTGFGSGAMQLIDAFVINCWPSNAQRIAVEIKVSRGDYASEIQRPLKRMSAYRLSNVFYFAAPAGMIKPFELPPDAGLIEVNSQGVAKITIEAPWHEGETPSWMFVASLARRFLKADLKGGQRAAEQPASLQGSEGMTDCAPTGGE